MKILLIGNFAPPYEDESLHNFSLLNRLKEEGNDCCVINISENPSKEKGFIDTKNFFDYVFKLVRYAWKKDVIHFLTKGYTRLGLLKVLTSIMVGRFFRSKPIITLHSEMFSVIGQMRSKVGGEQAIYTSFSMADKIIFCDKDTYEAASMYKKRDNFELIPPFIDIPEDIREDEFLPFKKAENKKRIVIFSNVRYPSFLFDILNNLLSEHPADSDIGIVVSLSEKFSSKLQHVIEESGKRLSENLVFIEPDDIRLLSMIYARASLVLRPLSCDGKTFFTGFTISLRKPLRSDNYICFPTSLLLVKEGETADLCACMINDILMGETDPPTGLTGEDFYAKIKDIYSSKT